MNYELDFAWIYCLRIVITLVAYPLTDDGMGAWIYDGFTRGSQCGFACGSRLSPRSDMAVKLGPLDEVARPLTPVNAIFRLDRRLRGIIMDTADDQVEP